MRIRFLGKTLMYSLMDCALLIPFINITMQHESEKMDYDPMMLTFFAVVNRGHMFCLPLHKVLISGSAWT